MPVYVYLCIAGDKNSIYSRVVQTRRSFSTTYICIIYVLLRCISTTAYYDVLVLQVYQL